MKEPPISTEELIEAMETYGFFPVAAARMRKMVALLREARQHIYHLTDPDIDTSGFIARIDAVVPPEPPVASTIDFDAALATEDAP